MQHQEQAEAQKVRLVVADGYEVVTCVGTGANGSVYKAEEKLSGLVSAIKVLNEQKDAEDVKRFQREAQVIAKLSHPNIVSMRGFGIKDGAPYLVMEFIEGDSLATLLKSSGRLTPERMCELMIQICDALQHAHEMGVFHRDIKPSNIMLARHGNREVAKLADFGIAKIKAQETRETLTQTGVVLGTPLYMSPEQSMGHQPDARSDIYSLGCVMYECLAGRAPVEGDNFLEVVYKRLNEPVPTFAQRGVDVPPSLANVIFHCLAHDAGMRYQSAREVADDLRAAMGGMKVAAPRKSKPRHPVASAGLNPFIGLVAGVLITVAGMAAWNAFQPKAAAPEAAQPKLAANYPSVTIANPDCKKLKLWLTLRGGGLGRGVEVQAIRPQTMGDEAYRKALADQGFQLLMSEWENWYANIFEKVNPPEAGKGPVMPEKVFGSFDVTVAHDGTCIVTSNLQIPDAAATQYAEKIKQILGSIPQNQLVMPQPLQQVKFRIDVSGNENRFDLAAIEAPLFADAPEK